MIKVEMVIKELKHREPWRRMSLAAVPCVGDLVSLDVEEAGSRVGRMVRVERVIFVADPSVEDHVILHASLLDPHEAEALAEDASNG